jgi:hypothetical protein
MVPYVIKSVGWGRNVSIGTLCQIWNHGMCSSPLYKYILPKVVHRSVILWHFFQLIFHALPPLLAFLFLFFSCWYNQICVILHSSVSIRYTSNDTKLHSLSPNTHRVIHVIQGRDPVWFKEE